MIIVDLSQIGSVFGQFLRVCVLVCLNHFVQLFKVLLRMNVCNNNFKVAVLRCSFVTRQHLTVIIRLGSSACGARVYWVKNLTIGRSCLMVRTLV